MCQRDACVTTPTTTTAAPDLQNILHARAKHEAKCAHARRVVWEHCSAFDDGEDDDEAGRRNVRVFVCATHRLCTVSNDDGAQEMYDDVPGDAGGSMLPPRASSKSHTQRVTHAERRHCETTGDV